MARKPSTLPIAVAAVILVTAACGGQPAAEQQDEGQETDGLEFELVIGSLPALTGPFAEYGEMSVKATDMAAQVANEAAEEAGVDVSVRIVSSDTEGDVEGAVSAARQVIGEGASCITGTLITPDTTAVAQSVTVQRRVPVFPLGTSVEISEIEDDDTIYRAIPPDTLQALILADATEQLVGDAGGSTVSVAYRNEPYGEGISERFTQEWESRGGETQGPVAFDPEQSSYNSEADQIISGDPDAYVIADYPDSWASVGSALVRTGEFDPTKLVVSDALHFPEIPEEIPNESLEGALTVGIGTDEEAETAEAFDDLWQGAPGPDRLPLDTHVFDNNMLCFLAAVAAGSTEPDQVVEQIRPISGPPGDKFTYLELSEAITALSEGRDIDYEGVSGPLDLDESGDPSGAVYDLFRYENGEAVFQERFDVER